MSKSCLNPPYVVGLSCFCRPMCGYRLAPVMAGLLLSLTGYAFFDPLIAGGVAVWFVASTGREVFQSHEELIWPEKIVCGHPDHDNAAVTAN
jgi:hypothetical protein